MAVVLAGLAALFSGSGDFLGGLASRHGRVLAVATLSHAFGVGATAVLAPFIGGAPSTADLLWGAVAGASGGLGILALYTGFARSSIGTVSPIAAVGTAAWPVLFALMQGERPGGLQAAGLVIGVIAIWMVARGVPSVAPAPTSPGVIFGMLAGLGFGGLLILLSRVSADAGIWPLGPARLFGGGVLVCLAVVADRPLVPFRASVPPLAAAGAATIVGNGAFILASQRGSLAVVSVMTAMFPAATVVLARIVLRERLGRYRLAGLVVALIAVALIAAG